MNRLYENALIYGRLLTIDRPHLVARYNKALRAFGLPETALDTFEIDRTGFSPQVAAELDDFDYLDPEGINRRFIILTPQQQGLPVVHTRFSNTGKLMHDFFAANARAIHALTIKDVIHGEIEDSVAVIDDMEDLLSIEQVRFRVLSADDMIGKANRLRALADRLKKEPDAWRDDAMLEQMVALAGDVGDIRQNSLVPDQVIFRHDAFWTSHFGGTFVFVDERMTTVVGDPSAPGFRKSRPWQVSYLSIGDHDRIFRFLAETGRLEMPRESWMAPAGHIDRQREMVLRELVRRHMPDAPWPDIDPVWLQTWAQRNADIVKRDGRYPVLNTARNRLGDHGHLDIAGFAPRDRFLFVRANPAHRDVWLVNRLLSVINAHDYLALYVFHKQRFYDDYETWPDGFRAHVVERLRSDYLNNKSGLRQKLFGIGPDQGERDA